MALNKYESKEQLIEHEAVLPWNKNIFLLVAGLCFIYNLMASLFVSFFISGFAFVFL